MRATDIWRAAAMWPADSAATGCNAGDHAGGFQPAFSGDGRRALRPQLARMDGLVSATGSTNQNSGPVSGGWQHTSGAGRADGGAVGPFGGGQPDGGFGFDQPVAKNGYAWWYVDGLSDDGESGITIIAFIGSVFSPYYAFARRRGSVDPLNHCAINVAIYRKDSNRWAMTERPRSAVGRTTNAFTVGPSHLSWDGKSLTIHIDEIAVPFPKRIRGTVRVVPTAITQQAFTLNENGHHQWWPIAPCARVQVTLDHPHLRWQGDGYFDMNRGDAPLERGFTDWQWARGAMQDGAIILYEAQRRDGSRIDLAMTFDPQGTMQTFKPPPAVELGRTGWRLNRSVRSDDRASVVKTLEDAPFYARSVVSAKLLRAPVTLMHESLSLNRFKMPVVQAMLPFRMPRALR
jgi:carotenoid 1,2-hydratase